MLLFVLLEFEGTRIELIVCALLGEEFLVAASLDDAAVIQYHDDIRIHDC